jgi:REP element-mobilizing transposase RayT
MSYKDWHSRGYLPRFDSAETAQFVTFRLTDSLPTTHAHLERGLGACWLEQPAIAQLVEDAIMHFDARRYCLLAWCVMPNHVHVIVEPIDGNRIGAIVHAWKSFSATHANRLLDRGGPFWHRDNADRVVRDESDLKRTIDDVENSPVRAGLASSAAAWPWSSSRLRASDPEEL